MGNDFQLLAADPKTAGVVVTKKGDWNESLLVI